MQNSHPTQGTTQKQIEANRLNAQLSSGPKTELGKARVALNALRHGLTGQVAMMTPEDREAFESHLAEYLKIHKPADKAERDLTVAIAEDQWRLMTARAVERNIYAVGHTKNAVIAAATFDESEAPNPQILAAFSTAQTFLDDARQFQLLSLYEQRIHRDLQKHLTELRAVQEKRKSSREKALNRAKLYAEMSYAAGKPWNPAKDDSIALEGFSITTAEVNAELREERRFKEALHYRNNDWKLNDGFGCNNPPLLDHAPEDSNALTLPAAA